MSEKSEACPLPNREEDDRIRGILGRSRVVAVVGMSARKERPSNEVALYLRDHGFRIIPVHPAGGEIEGMPVYPDLLSIPAESGVEIVDLFVAGHRTLPLVEQAARIGAPLVWFQPGAESSEAEARARELGLEVVSGRCTMADHKRLIAS